MKLILALCLTVAVTAAPQSRRENINDVQIIRYDNDNRGEGNYKFSFEQSDGTKHEVQGTLLNEETDNESIAVKGSYSWVGPDGVTYTVNYTADDRGYQPEIEQGPGGSVPQAVIQSLLG